VRSRMPGWGILTELPSGRLKPAVRARLCQTPPEPQGFGVYASCSDFHSDNTAVARERERVLEPHAGANDVRTLAPGVYFVAEHGSRCTVHARKLVVTK